MTRHRARDIEGWFPLDEPSACAKHKSNWTPRAVRDEAQAKAEANDLRGRYVDGPSEAVQELVGPLYRYAKDPKRGRPKARPKVKRKYEYQYPWLCCRIPSQRDRRVRVKPPKYLVDKLGWHGVRNLIRNILRIEAARRRKPDEDWVYNIYSMWRKEGKREFEIVRYR